MQKGTFRPEFSRMNIKFVAVDNKNSCPIK